MAGIHPFGKQTLHKSERLCNRALINTLFTQGSHFTVYPIRVHWLLLTNDQPAPVQLLIQTRRNRLRLAVKRNLVKRRIREAYRKNKEIIYGSLEQKGGKSLLAMVYMGDAILPYTELEPIIILILQRLTREYEKVTG